MGTVIAFANMKGGVGKTALTYVLVASAKKLLRLTDRILTVDLDPQANLTSILLPPTTANYIQDINIAKFFEEKASFQSRIHATKIQDVEIAPSYIDLAIVENEMRTDPLWPLKLKNALDGVKQNYDLIVLDCPPNIGPLTVNGLVAADHVFVPVTPDSMAMVGFTRIKDTIDRIKILNPNIKLSGIIPNMIDRRYASHNAYVEFIRRTDTLPKMIGPVTRRAAILRLVEFGKQLSEEIADGDPELKNELISFTTSILEIVKAGGTHVQTAVQ
ncbi:MAG: AAA family ATPase [Candidatus Methanomethylicaceae archaeon]